MDGPLPTGRPTSVEAGRATSEDLVTNAWPAEVQPQPAMELNAFADLVWARGMEQYRDLPWRHTRDPYAVWISEVMLQQTQVSRVDGRWQRWLDRFPTVEALAQASQADVLAEWQGMGYNRRALALHHAAGLVVQAGEFPTCVKDLMALPGIGPATAAGIRAFAFNLPGVYLETNVRSVFLHELYPNEINVPDKRLVPLVEAACPRDDVRGWYYALLDYGAWLKRTTSNPSRRSRTHTRQSEFKGSHRQKRAAVVRMLLAAHDAGEGLCAKTVARELTCQEEADGRDAVSVEYASKILSELEAEGFCSCSSGEWVM